VAGRLSARTRRHLADAVARWVVTAGGLATIASIVSILAFICIEVRPLWQGARADVASAFGPIGDGKLLAAAVDEYRHYLVGISAAGSVYTVRLSDGRQLAAAPIDRLNGRPLTSVARAGRDEFVVGTADGRVLGLRTEGEGRAGARDHVALRIVDAGEWRLSPEGEAIAVVAGSGTTDRGVTLAAAPAGQGGWLFIQRTTRSLFGEQRSEVRHPLALPAGVHSTAFAVSTDGTRAYVGSSDGAVQYWDLRDADQPVLVDAPRVTRDPSVPVSALGLLLGDVSLVVGGGDGAVSVWFPVRDRDRTQGWRLQQIHVFDAHSGAVTSVAASPRDKSFLTGATSGEVFLRHATTERTLLRLGHSTPVAALAYAPKANGGVAIGSDATATHWDLINPHPEVTLTTLFGQVWYEGYEAPAHVWQSTGGTDDFEPKLSLVPLILGTMKGTLYALLFAVPLAVLGALYTAQFAHPSLRQFVKPTVEVMAALPSVVLGFLAGLWLAPTLEAMVPATLAMIFGIPAAILLVGAVLALLPATGSLLRVRPGSEVVWLVPLIVGGVALCQWANPWLEATFFGGDFSSWLLGTTGLRYDQRNCLVVGFAMGFAVIPIIFTISEDALSNVPQRLISGSLALGATRWQTALRVVLPTASPGIFSAIMVGFGRAVGETMIVLMATGNTPVLDWNVFTGMRTLSANIAVEIPEAPAGGTLYRVLFLAALLLFIATFIVNTAAEVVRLRLRRRYQQL
jgi:phosphate transport system permease protein